MNNKIIDILIAYFKDIKQLLIHNVDDFEEKINELAPDMIEECFLIVKAVRTGVYDMYLLTPLADKKLLIDFFRDKGEVSEEEAVFTIGVLEQVLENISMQMSIMNIDDIKKNALEHNILFQIKMVALAYYEGEGAIQDYEEAFQLFEYLLKHGDYSVLSYLGYMYENGFGVEEDIMKAIEYYEQGSVVSDQKCLYYLGMCYLYGKGHEKNESMALSCLKQCQMIDAYKALGKFYSNKAMHGEAFQYYCKAAYSFDKDALYRVGICYFEGIGTSKNISEAKKYLTYASYFNHRNAFCQLGIMMIEGIGFTKDIDKGLEYVRKAASMKCKDAYLVLGKFYEFGIHVEKDIYKATAYYSKFNEEDVEDESI